MKYDLPKYFSVVNNGLSDILSSASSKLQDITNQTGYLPDSISNNVEYFTSLNLVDYLTVMAFVGSSILLKRALNKRKKEPVTNFLDFISN